MDVKIKPAKLQFYDNRQTRLTAAQVRAKTGADYVMNCVAFNFSTFQPVMGFRMDGQTVVLDDDYYGIAWNDASDVTMARASAGHANYMTFVPIVHDGEAMQMYIGSDVKGSRQRTAFGVYPDGDVWLYAVKSPAKTPEQIQALALEKGCTHAVLLDSGGSTCASCAAEEVTTSRAIPIFLCIWEDRTSEENRGEEQSMFKLALGAGHGINTSGKRCLKALDPNETREWWLNDRICDYVESYLKQYDGYELLRLDDSDDGEDDIALSTRVNRANTWGADFYLSVHHNAGINGGSGGGIVAFSYYNTGGETVEWRDELYEALIEYTGLKGNRSQPKTTAGFYVLKYTKMPAVLLELGFMDSKTDVPIILTEDYAKACAKAIVEVMVRRGKLNKKAAATESGTRYKVQVGAFVERENAVTLAAELKKDGYASFIVETKGE